MKEEETKELKVLSQEAKQVLNRNETLTEVAIPYNSPNLFFEMTKTTLKENFSAKEKIITAVLSKFFEHKMNFNMWDRSIFDFFYYFLHESAETIVSKVNSKNCPGFSAEALNTTQQFLLMTQEKFKQKLKVQKEIIAFFIAAGCTNKTHLLVQAVCSGNVYLAEFLIQEKKADFNTAMKKNVPYPDAGLSIRSCSTNAVSELVELSLRYPLISQRLLKLLFQNGFDPTTRHPFRLLGLLPFETILALAAAAHPEQKRWNMLYELTFRHLAFKSRLTVCIGFHKNSQSALFTSFKSNPTFEAKLVPLIFDFIGIGLNSPLNLKPLERFKEKEKFPKLLFEEINDYNNEVRLLFCLGLYSVKNQKNPLQILPRDAKDFPFTVPSYKNAIHLIFQYAGVDKLPEEKFVNYFKSYIK